MACDYLYNGVIYTKQELEDYIKSNPQEFSDLLTPDLQEFKMEMNNFDDLNSNAIQDATSLFSIGQASQEVINFQSSPANFTEIISYKKELLSKLEAKYDRWKAANKQNFRKDTYKKKNTEYFNVIKKLEQEITTLDTTKVDQTVDFISKEIEFLSSIIDDMKDSDIEAEDLEDRIDFLSKYILGRSLDNIGHEIIWDGSAITGYNDKIIAPLNDLLNKLGDYRKNKIKQLIKDSPAFNEWKKDMTEEEFKELINKHFYSKMKDINMLQQYFLGLNSNDDSGYTALAYELYHKNIVINRSQVRDKIKEFVDLGDKLRENNFSLDNFLDKDNDGIDTGNIINKFTNLYTSSVLPRLYGLIKEYRTEKDYKSGAKTTAYQNLISWYKSHANIIDYRKIKVLKDAYINHPEYSKYFIFSEQEMNDYENQLRADLGSYYDTMIESSMAKLEDFEQQHLAKAAKQDKYLTTFVAENSPFEFIQNYYNTPFNPIKITDKYSRYNNSSFIEFTPLKERLDIDTGELRSTGYYNSKFDIIENNPTAYKYWQSLTDLYQNFINPTYIESGQDINSLSWAKIDNTLSDEIIKNSRTKEGIAKIPKILINAWQDMWFEDGDPQDPNKIRDNYFDTTKSEINKYVKAIVNFDLESLNDTAKQRGIKTLTRSEILNGVDPKNEDYVIKEYKRVIANKLARQSVFKNKSTDLTKITHALSELAVLQRARQDSTTLMDTLYREHRTLTDEQGLERDKSNSKFNSWKRTNIYNSLEGHGNKEFKIKALSDFEKELQKILIELKDKVKSTEDVSFSIGENQQVKRVSGNYYKYDEKGKGTSITEEQFYKFVEDYIDNEIDKLGTPLSVESAVNGWINNTVIKNFVVNPISGIRNRLEGMFTNMILDQSGRYWTAGNDINSKRFLAFSNILKFGGDKISVMNRSHYAQFQTLQQLVEEFNILQDRKNEIEKRDKESSYGKLKKRLNPFAMAIDNPEFKNQVSVMLNMLQDFKVKDNNGNTHPFFDSKSMSFTIYKPGTLELKEQFRNHNSDWETFKFNEDSVEDNSFFVLKERISSAISEIQGNYSNVDSIQFHQKKSKWGLRWGKILMLYMRWFPAHVNQRFGSRNIDFIQGKSNQVGRFSAMKNAPIASTYIGTSSTLLFGPGAGILFTGLPLIYFAGKMIYDKAFLKKNINAQAMSLKVGAGFLQEVLLKSLSLPLKMLYMRKGALAVDSIPNKLISELSSQEQGAVKSLAQDLAVQIQVMMVMLLLKSLMEGGSEGDDEDKKNMFHNFIDNEGNKMISNLAMWTNPSQMVKDNTQVALIRTVGDVIKFSNDVTKLLAGDKIDTDRPISTVARNQPIVPIPNVIIKAIVKGEYPGLDSREYQNSQWFDRYTKSDEWSQDNIYKKKRADFKEQYKDHILEILSEEHPEYNETELEEMVDKQVRSRMNKSDIKKAKGESSKDAMKRIQFENKEVE